MSEMNPQAMLATVYPIIENVPHLHNYGSSDMLDAHFEKMSKEKPLPGVQIDRQQLGEQSGPEGITKPLIQTTIRVGDGHIGYFKGGVHGDELVFLESQEYLSNLAWRSPEYIRGLGIGELNFLNGDPWTVDLNTWHFGRRTLYHYLSGMQRSRFEVDWDYPVTYNGITYESKVPGCIASQQIITEKQPDLVFSGHNAKVGSYYSYVMNEPSTLATPLSILMQQIYGGPPSAPDIPTAASLKIAEGVYQFPEWEAMLPELFGGDGDNLSHLSYGSNSLQFATRHAQQQRTSLPIGSLAEPAYFKVRALADNRLSGATERSLSVSLIERSLRNLDYVEQQVRGIEVKPASIAENLREDIVTMVPWWRAQLEPKLQKAQKKPKHELTIAEAAQIMIYNSFYPTGPLGNLVNLVGRAPSAQRDSIETRLQNEASWLERKLGTVPMQPRTLVQVQVGAVLLSASVLNDRG